MFILKSRRLELKMTQQVQIMPYCRLQTLPCCSWENENEVDIKQPQNFCLFSQQNLAFLVRGVLTSDPSEQRDQELKVVKRQSKDINTTIHSFQHHFNNRVTTYLVSQYWSSTYSRSSVQFSSVQPLNKANKQD